MKKETKDPLSETRELFAYDQQRWDPIVTEGAEDMHAAAGDTWDPEDRREREDANRPIITADEISQYVNQAINGLRAYKRAIQFTANGNGANDQTAEFYANKTREIEYRSQAQIAYITAAENAIQRSYGFVRVDHRLADPRAINHDLFIDPVHDPDAVTPGADAVMPNLSDMTRCWVRKPFEESEFKRKFPKADVKGITPDLMRLAPAWIDDRRIWVAEQWAIHHTPSKFLIVIPHAPHQPRAMPGLQQGQPQQGSPDPIGIFEDEIHTRYGGKLPGVVHSTEMRDVPSVCQYLTNGVEILDEVQWPGKYIPIIGCVGKVIFVKGERRILSMIRFARGLQQLLNYYVSCEAELVGMTPKFPYFYYEGQLSPESLLDLARSNHEPVAGIAVKPTTEGVVGTVLPHPQRNPFEPAIQALEIGKESTRRAIQAAMAQSFLPTQAQRRNEKSGVALQKIEQSAQQGSFHFKDHFEDMIRHVGVVVEDLMDKIYDSARTVGIRKANDDAEDVRINDAYHAKSIHTQGDHLVTISTGPSYDSERDAASDFADTLAGSSPEVFALLGPLIVKLKNLGPIGDEMAELLETMQPPQVQALKQAKQDGVTDPMAAAQQLAQAKAMIQQLQQALQKAAMQIQTDTAKYQAQGQIEQMKLQGTADLQLKLKEMDNAAKIAVARIAAAKETLNIQAEAAEERLSTGLTLLHDLAQQNEDRAHELGMAALSHQQATDAADQAHQHALEQGAAGVVGDMETAAQGSDLAMQQASQQQALQPPPDAASA